MNLFAWDVANQNFIPVTAAPDGSLWVLLSSGSALIGKVDINSFLAALPTGSNVIGKVDINTMKPLVAGTANIGDVDVLTLPPLPAGGNLIGVVNVNTLPPLPAGSFTIGKVNIGTFDNPVGVLSLPVGSNLIGKVDINSIPVVQVKSQTGNSMLDYNSQVLGALGTASLPAGTSTYDSGTPAAGHVWRIEQIALYYVGTIAGVYIGANIWTGATEYVFAAVSPPVSSQIYPYKMDLTLKAGDKLRLRVGGATLNDDAWLNFDGYDSLIS